MPMHDLYIEPRNAPIFSGCAFDIIYILDIRKNADIFICIMCFINYMI